MSDNFWIEDEEETKARNLNLGSSYPPVKVFISAVQIGRINSKVPVVIPVILSDGKELDLEIILDTDRDKFARDLRESIEESEKEDC